MMIGLVARGALVVAPALVWGPAARVQGRVSWVAAETPIVSTDDPPSVGVDLSQVDQASGDRVIVTGPTSDDGNRVIATPIRSLTPSRSGRRSTCCDRAVRVAAGPVIALAAGRGQCCADRSRGRRRMARVRRSRPTSVSKAATTSAAYGTTCRAVARSLMGVLVTATTPPPCRSAGRVAPARPRGTRSG